MQNILVFRFANGIFEPVWNRRYIDHVQITVAESLGVRVPRPILRTGRRLAGHGAESPFCSCSVFWRWTAQLLCRDAVRDENQRSYVA